MVDVQAMAPQLGDLDLQTLVPARRGDDELVDLLQLRVAAGEPSPDSFVREMDVYSADPRDILGDGKQEALCFSTVESAGGGSTQRRKREAAAPSGAGVRCWHQDHGKKPILDRAYKRTLYYVSKTKIPNRHGGQQKITIKRLGYTMTEYELRHLEAGAEKLVLCKVYRSSRTNPETAMATASCAQQVPRWSNPEARSICNPKLASRPSMKWGPLPVVAVEAPHGGKKPALWPTVVMKFGRSSLASAAGMKQVAKLLGCFNEETPVVVLSAMGETTDNLLQAGHQAMRCDPQEVCKILDLAHIKKSHLSTVHELGLQNSSVSATLDSLERHLKRIARTKDLSAKKLDRLLSFGERLSTNILSAYLNELGTKALQYNALDLALMTTDKYTDIIQATYSAIAEQLEDWIDEPAMPIIAGSLGKEWGSCAITTFGRGVSDLTAVTIGRALESKEIQIWKDVDGVLTCDPIICSNAIPIPFLTFHEAAELAYFGAPVLHSDTRRSAREGGIPVRVKNLYNPHRPGTLITTTRDMCKSTLTGIVIESNITVLDIESTRKLGQNGFLLNILSVLEGSGISVDYMATDKGKISLALDPSKLLNSELIQPVLDNVVEEIRKTAVIHVLEHRSVVSLVGNVQMLSFIHGTASNVLRSTGVKVQMIWQGSSNSEVVKVSLVVHDSDAKDCVQALHSAFFENGFVAEVEGAENKCQIPAYTSTAASSGVKRKAQDDHPEDPQSVRLERAVTEPSEPEETELRLPSDNHLLTVGDDNGDLSEVFKNVSDDITLVTGEHDWDPSICYANMETTIAERPTRCGDSGDWTMYLSEDNWVLSGGNDGGGPFEVEAGVAEDDQYPVLLEQPAPAVNGSYP